eukprot:878346-Pyramimonas_sp.AAC.1
MPPRSFFGAKGAPRVTRIGSAARSFLSKPAPTAIKSPSSASDQVEEGEGRGAEVTGDPGDQTEDAGPVPGARDPE